MASFEIWINFLILRNAIFSQPDSLNVTYIQHHSLEVLNVVLVFVLYMTVGARTLSALARAISIVATATW